MIHWQCSVWRGEGCLAWLLPANDLSSSCGGLSPGGLPQLEQDRGEVGGSDAQVRALPRPGSAPAPFRPAGAHMYLVPSSCHSPPPW